MLCSSDFYNRVFSRTWYHWVVFAALSLFFGQGSLHAQAPVNPKDLDVYGHANIFEPLTTPGHIINDVAWFVMWVCAGIFVVVTFLIVYAIMKFRVKPSDDKSEPPQVYGSTQIELAWTVVPILITMVLILVTSRTIGEVQNKEIPKNAVEVRVIGRQWWWEIRYPQYGIVTANEIHIPVSSKETPRPTSFLLQSADVLHSFWVPQLNGKTDLVPNRDNRTWMDPFKPGVYLGNCAEYCGTQHANMQLRVVVQEQADFDAWVESQKRPAVQDAAVAKGREDFATLSCINCHNVNGVPHVGTVGIFGPDLTHFASRQTLGAGIAKLTPENVKDWLHDPQKMKIGCYMPNMQLTPQQVDDITAYLISLE